MWSNVPSWLLIVLCAPCCSCAIMFKLFIIPQKNCNFLIYLNHVRCEQYSKNYLVACPGGVHQGTVLSFWFSSISPLDLSNVYNDFMSFHIYTVAFSHSHRAYVGSLQLLLNGCLSQWSVSTMTLDLNGYSINEWMNVAQNVSLCLDVLPQKDMQASTTTKVHL